MNPIPITVGDTVRLRKPHPCGSHEWTVTRTGADIGLQCDSCGRRVMLDREVFERRTVQVVARESIAASVAEGSGC